MTDMGMNARMRITKVAAAVCAGSVIVTACTHQRVNPTDQIRGVTPGSTRVDSGNNQPRLSAIYGVGNVQYSFESIAIIQSTSGDSIPRTDSTRVAAVLTAVFQVPNSQQEILVSTRIDSLEIVSLPLQSTRVITSWPSAERIFLINSRTGRATFSVAPGTCAESSQESPLRGNEMLPVVPSDAPTKIFWTDTTVQQICRGGISLRVSQSARYQVLTQIADSGSTYLILRSSEAVLDGSGHQWQQPVQVTGRSSSVDTLFIDRSTARMKRLLGLSHLELIFKSARRDQRFIQTALTQITLR